MSVYSKRLKLVGNIDLIFVDKQGKFNICDYKRMEGCKPSFKNDYCKFPLNDYLDCEKIKHSLQLSIYKKILEEEYGLQINRLYNLYIINDKPYNFKEREYIDFEGLINKKIKELITNGIYKI